MHTNAKAQSYYKSVPNSNSRWQYILEFRSYNIFTFTANCMWMGSHSSLIKPINNPLLKCYAVKSIFQDRGIREVFQLRIFLYHGSRFIIANRAIYPFGSIQTVVLQAIWFFVYSKVLHIQLPLHKIQELNTIDFQGKNHYLTSIGIPKKRGKYAL